MGVGIYLFTIVLKIAATMVNVHHDIAERIQVLSYLVVPLPIAQILTLVTFSETQVYRIAKKARERGWHPILINPAILFKYVEDAPRSGRPIKATEAKEEEVVQLISRDRYGRSKTVLQLGTEVGLSRETVRRILIRRGYTKCKPSTKPGLTPDMKAARLNFCLQYKDWTIEDWKRVIWYRKQERRMNQQISEPMINVFSV